MQYFSRGDEVQSASMVPGGAPGSGPYALSNLNAWAMALDHLGRLGEAETVYKRGLAVAPDIHQLNNNLANIYRKTNRPADAAHWYSLAVKATLRQPAQERAELFKYHYNHGMSLRDLGDPKREEAMAAMESALAIKPDLHQVRATEYTAARVQMVWRYLRTGIVCSFSFV